ncbi:MAG: carboxy terminal-processing peptidase [Verrucomicrobia bacterium]|nr:carboxy terminal-processing peptidase [Verrucomicrobiota bacterium]
MKLAKHPGWCLLALALMAAQAAETEQKPPAAPPQASAVTERLVRLGSDLTLLDRQRTNHVVLRPGEDDRKISQIVGMILRQSHYSQIPFDDAMSSKFLDRYLDALDPAHLLFLQSDEEEFNRWRETLDDLTLRLGDTSPAYSIFNRFLERYEEQMGLATNLIATEKFTFDGQERYLINRRDQPRPKGMAEARQLWHERVRYEYLLEKLNLSRPDEVGKLIEEKLNKKSAADILASIASSKQKKAQLKKEQEAAAAAASTNDAPAAEIKVYNEITGVLKGKMGDEKADQIADFVAERLGKEKPAEMAKAIVAKLEKDNADEIVKIITRRYSRQWRMLKEFDSDEVLQIYLTALAHAYDPHSDYMSRSALENFNISMRLSLFGIGAVLTSEDGYVKIRELMNGPAKLSRKVKPNDKIVAVAQGTNEPVDVIDWKLNKVVDLIRGPKGSEVRLTMIPADAPDPSMRKHVALIRNEVKLEDQEAKAKIIELPLEDKKTLRLGVIDLSSFYSNMDSRKPDRKSTTTDVKRLLTKLKQEEVKGVILDLRHNGGGSLEEAINLTGLFIKQGPVVQVRDSNGTITVDSDTDEEVVCDGPLIVLTSRFSASASEILAGALQDYGRAVVVGDVSTHGKGTVQSLLKLAPLVRPPPTNDAVLGALKYTIRKFYRVTGSSTQLKGVMPDIVLPSVNNHADTGEASITNAMPWDTIRKADFEPVNVASSYLDELRKRSAERVDKDKDFAFVRDDISRYQKTKEDKTVSMNEAERWKEKKENEARAEARKKELKARGEPNYKTYDITLKLADEPGLPAPTTKTNAVAAKVTSFLDDDPEADQDDSAPSVDPSMEEGKRILRDLIELTQKSGGLAGAGK